MIFNKIEMSELEIHERVRFLFKENAGPVFNCNLILSERKLNGDDVYGTFIEKTPYFTKSEDFLFAVFHPVFHSIFFFFKLGSASIGLVFANTDIVLDKNKLFNKPFILEFEHWDTIDGSQTTKIQFPIQIFMDSYNANLHNQTRTVTFLDGTVKVYPEKND